MAFLPIQRRKDQLLPNLIVFAGLKDRSIAKALFFKIVLFLAGAFFHHHFHQFLRRKGSF